MRENCTSGSVRGALGNQRSYRKRKHMEISKKELVETYSNMSDEKIIGLYLQNTLTAIAKDAIQQVIISRGLPLEHEELKRLLDESESDNSLAKDTSLMASSALNKSNYWWNKNLFGTLSVCLAVIIAILGVALSLIIGSSGYMFACAAAFFITPFGLLSGLLGIWKDNVNEKATIGIILNIVLFVIGLFLNPIALVGGHDLH